MFAQVVIVEGVDFTGSELALLKDMATIDTVLVGSKGDTGVEGAKVEVVFFGGFFEDVE